MEIKGKLIGFTFDYNIEKFVINLAVESTGEILQNLFTKVKDKVLSISLKEKRDKRSLDANAFYWEFVSKLADKLQISNARCHNELLAEFSEVLTIDGQLVTVEIKESESAYNEVLESSMHHLKPTAHIFFKDNEVYRVYHMMLGSSEMDTKQMSRLINGLIDKCNEQGIPTITEEETERMLAAYGKRVQ